MIRFLWLATKGYRFHPWDSPYLRWRVETYSGRKAESLTFRDFWHFLWRNKGSMSRYLRWVSRMANHS